MKNVFTICDYICDLICVLYFFFMELYVIYCFVQLYFLHENYLLFYFFKKLFRFVNIFAKKFVEVFVEKMDTK